MNYLITGGMGFIGANLVRRLLENPNNHVSILDKEATNYHNLKREDRHFKFIIGDITEPGFVDFMMKNIDYVIHLAAESGVQSSLEDPMYVNRVNVGGTLVLLETARFHKVKRFIFASSNAVVGDQQLPMNENSITKPISPYGVSKLAGETYCSTYYNNFGLNTTSFRFSNVYGSFLLHKDLIISMFLKCLKKDKPLKIFGDGFQTRDFLYVEDLIDVLLLSLERNDLGGEVFQVATGQEIHIIYLVSLMNEITKDILGKEVKIEFTEKRKGDIVRNYSDVSKIKEILKWTPKYSLEEGITKTIEWFKENNHE